MTAAACQISPSYHLKTQILQSLAAFSAGGAGFIIYGWYESLPLAYGTGLLLLLVLHASLARQPQRRMAPAKT